MDIKKLIKSLLFVFIAVSFTVLIYKEFSPRNENNALGVAGTNVTATNVDSVVQSGESMSALEKRPSKEPVTKKIEETPLPRKEVKSQDSKVIAYYLHGTFRCTTCRTIEQYSHDAIQTYFSKELGTGRLEFRPLNVEEAENRHFIQDYQLVSRSLVLSLVSDGKEKKWKNLPDIWKLVPDKDKFFQYVKGEVEQFLKET